MIGGLFIPFPDPGPVCRETNAVRERQDGVSQQFSLLETERFFSCFPIHLPREIVGLPGPVSSLRGKTKWVMVPSCGFPCCQGVAPGSMRASQLPGKYHSGATDAVAISHPAAVRGKQIKLIENDF